MARRANGTLSGAAFAPLPAGLAAQDERVHRRLQAEWRRGREPHNIQRYISAPAWRWLTPLRARRIGSRFLPALDGEPCHLSRELDACLADRASVVVRCRETWRRP